MRSNRMSARLASAKLERVVLGTPTLTLSTKHESIAPCAWCVLNYHVCLSHLPSGQVPRFIHQGNSNSEHIAPDILDVKSAGIVRISRKVSPTAQRLAWEFYFMFVSCTPTIMFLRKKLIQSTEFETELWARSRCGRNQLNDVSCLIFCRNVRW